MTTRTTKMSIQLIKQVLHFSQSSYLFDNKALQNRYLPVKAKQHLQAK